MGTKHRCAAALLLAVFLLFCTACGAAPVQPEDTENKDQYMTDPVPEGKPAPVEPQDVVRDDDAELIPLALPLWVLYRLAAAVKSIDLGCGPICPCSLKNALRVS